MKIYCDKCHEDVSSDVDIVFDKLQVGHFICPKCHKENRRYVSETDLLLYLGLSELFYLFISIITKIVMDKFRLSYVTAIAVIAILVIGFIVQKQIDRYVYENAYFKKDRKYKEREEDKDQISRSLVWQSMLFLALTISYITLEEVNVFFLLVSVAAIILTFVKFYLSLKNELKEK